MIRVCKEHKVEGRCTHCQLANASPTVGKTKLPSDPRESIMYTPKLSRNATHEERVDYLQRLARDPVAMANLRLQMRRPANVSKSRFGVALNKGEPMLNVLPADMSRSLSLSYKSESRGNPAVDKGPLHARLIVQADSITASRYKDRAASSGFWGERLWSIYPTRYGGKFVAVTDEGDFTPAFDSVKQLRAAVQESGWKIVRQIS